MFQFDHFPKLYTKRLTLRALTRQDAPALFALFSDTEVTKYNDVTTFQEIGEAYGLLDFLDNRFRKEQGLRWAITRRGG
jgi:[ribosomal protein S5]-alanine N-acetyltransferase